MAIYHEDIVNVELESGNVFRSFSSRRIGKSDNLANRFGVRLMRGNEPQNIGNGSCMGVFMAPDGTNIAITGSDYTGVNGNIAWVQLPQACYNVEGQFALAIKVIGGGVTGTMRIVDGVVDNTGVTGAVAPTDSVPTYQEVLAVYDEMVAQLEAFDALKEAHEGVPTRNLIDDFDVTSDEKEGLELTKVASGTYHIEGTKTGTGTPNFILYRNHSALPEHMQKEKEYCVSVSSEQTFIWISAYYNNSYDGATTLFRSPAGETYGKFLIPDDCTGIGITIRFDDGTEFDEDIQIYLAERASNAKRNAITDAIIVSAENVENIRNITATYKLTEKTVNGVSGVKTGDNTYHISGTRTNPSGWTTLDLFRSHTVMPEGFEAGGSYSIYLDSEDISFWVIAYDGDEDTNGTALYKSNNNRDGDQFGTFTIPETGVQGLSLAFKGEYAQTFDEDVTLIISATKTAAEQGFINSVNGSAGSENTKKMFSIGNSFLTGEVYQDYNKMGPCEFKDAIYGQIAMELGISAQNTHHIYHPNTGFISPSSSPAYDAHSEVILDTDLSPYDYCLTHFNRSDLRKELGTVDADGTGTTLADAVVRIVNYVIASKITCKLIFLGTPPYDADAAGPNVFDYKEGDNSIDDMDNLMYALAVKYHFIYVSWQDLEISYHYMDFCDYHPGDTGAIHANSPDTYRALGNYAANQIKAVSSPIAVGKLMAIISGE